MPRHVPDDFRFLPTVDSTEEELVELEEQRKIQPPEYVSWGMEDQEPAAAEPREEAPAAHAPAVFSPDPAFAAAGPPAVFPRADQMQQVVEDLLNREVEYDEPPVQDVPPEQQDGQELWQEFMEGRRPPPAGVAVEEDPDRFESGAPTVTMVVSPAEAAARMRQMTAPAGAAPAPPKEAEEEKPLPTPRAPAPLIPRVDRASQGKRALLETPAVSLGRLMSVRKKEQQGPATDLEKLAAPGAGQSETAGQDDPATSSTDEAASRPFTAPKPASEEPLDPDQLKKLRWRKLAEKAGFQSLGWSVVVHLLILGSAGFIGYNQIVEKQVDFLPGGGSAQSRAAAAELTQKVQQKKNPWLKAKPQMRKVTVQTLSADIVLPEMPMEALDLSSITDRMDISKAPGMGLAAPMGMGSAGAGGGFGAGIGRGGKFSFVGQTALGSRVVFVVDVSGSMSARDGAESISRFELLKKELTKSVSMIPMNTQYQILFFSDFAWPHNEVDSRNVDALTKYRWEIEPGTYKKVKLPTFRFIQATPFSIRDTVDIIKNSDNPGGTNWGSGLLMALNASPKPDVIFFMTDGLRSDEQGWVDIVTAENKRRLPMTTIHTSAMQQPDAARELDDLARRNNGKFTVVLGDGKIVKGEDFFKMKK